MMPGSGEFPPLWLQPDDACPAQRQLGSPVATGLSAFALTPLSLPFSGCPSPVGCSSWQRGWWPHPVAPTIRCFGLVAHLMSPGFPEHLLQRPCTPAPRTEFVPVLTHRQPPTLSPGRICHSQAGFAIPRWDFLSPSSFIHHDPQHLHVSLPQPPTLNHPKCFKDNKSCC